MFPWRRDMPRVPVSLRFIPKRYDRDTVGPGRTGGKEPLAWARGGRGLRASVSPGGVGVPLAKNTSQLPQRGLVWTCCVQGSDSLSPRVDLGFWGTFQRKQTRQAGFSRDACEVPLPVAGARRTVGTNQQASRLRCTVRPWAGQGPAEVQLPTCERPVALGRGGAPQPEEWRGGCCFRRGEGQAWTNVTPSGKTRVSRQTNPTGLLVGWFVSFFFACTF